MQEEINKLRVVEMACSPTQQKLQIEKLNGLIYQACGMANLNIRKGNLYVFHQK